MDFVNFYKTNCQVTILDDLELNLVSEAVKLAKPVNVCISSLVLTFVGLTDIITLGSSR
jgi:hypothetical protein